MNMPTKTVYVSSADEELWEKAGRYAGGSLSELVTGFVKKFVAEHEEAEGKTGSTRAVDTAYCPFLLIAASIEGLKPMQTETSVANCLGKGCALWAGQCGLINDY